MAKYRKVLLAVDFHDDNLAIIGRAKEVITDNDAELHIIHVNEPFTTAYTADGVGTWSDELYMLEANIRKESQQKLDDLAERLDVKPENTYLQTGRPAPEIHDVVNANGMDLIVMGTHSQHGLESHLGSTATNVLHGGSCDVLAVRVGS